MDETLIMVPHLNGACQWVMHDVSDDDEYSVLWFDTSSEVFQEVKGPQKMRSEEEVFLCLYDDLLAMILYGERDGTIDVMVMKEEGCWTKNVNVGVQLVPGIYPRCLWNKKEIIFIEHFKRVDQLVLYDPDTDEIRKLGINYSSLKYDHVFIHKDSLVRLKGDVTRVEGKYIVTQSLSGFLWSATD